MLFLKDPIRRRLFNFLSLPLALLIIIGVAAGIIGYIPKTYPGADEWLSSSDTEEFLVITIAAITCGIALVLWHVWMVIEIISNWKQRAVLRWSLAALLTTYLLIAILLWCFAP